MHELYAHMVVFLFFCAKSVIFDIFVTLGGDTYIRDGARRPYTAGTDQSELSITQSSLDSPT